MISLKWEKSTVSYNHSKNIRDKLWFSSEIVPYKEKEFLATIEKIFIFAERLGTSL